jgi:hypothetical protein
MELAIENKIKQFIKNLKWLNPTVITLSFVDLLLGLLAISYIDLSTPALIASLSSLTMIFAIFTKFQSLKKQTIKLGIHAEELLKYSKNYNCSSLIWGLLDVIFGGLAIVATSIAFLSTISSMFKFKIVAVGNKLITLQKIQSVFKMFTKNKKLTQSGAIIGISYIALRNKKFLKEIKIMFKKFFTLLWGNKITGLMTGAASASFVYFQDILPQFAESYLYAGIAFVVMYIFACFFGGEYLYQIVQRFADKKLSKEQAAIVKANAEKAKKAAEELENAKKVVEQYEKAQALINASKQDIVA